MTLREYVQSLAQRLNKIEGTSGVSKDYVDAADDIIRGSVTALRRHVDIEDEAIRGSIVTLGETVDEIIDGTQPVASAMEADSAVKATNTASGLNIDDELAALLTRFAGVTIYSAKTGASAKFNLPSGRFIIFIIKPQYGRSGILSVDGNVTQWLVNPGNITFTITPVGDENEYYSSELNYASVIALRV